MLIENAKFICFPENMVDSLKYDDPAPIFRHKFNIKEKLITAKLSLATLGIGKVYINEKPLTNNLFITPVSDYTKTVWYNTYDVTDLLRDGENLVAIALGNGFYNVSFEADWAFHKAPWRDSPKLMFYLELEYFDGIKTVTSNTDWLCNRECSPYRFNQLQMGEIYDYNYATNWMDFNFDDSTWVNAIIAKIPSGTLRENPAPPITEDKVYKCVGSFKNQNGDLVFDFGQNISGYIRLKTKQPVGTKLHIIYAEQLHPDGTRKDNNMSYLYKEGETQVCDIICGENEIDYRPDFSYSGFRYVIISGAKKPITESDVLGVFVHQDVEIKGDFKCSDELLNKIYYAARMSSLSNLFNMPTDCPTREKLGWCNDAQASCEQMLQNYKIEELYDKWLQDISDAMKPDGDLPGIVPSSGWGYAWGSGPVSTGVLFEIPYRLYQYNNNEEPLKKYYNAFLKHLDFLEGKINDNGLCAHGLTDWAGPFETREGPVPLEFVCTVLLIKFYRITSIAAQLVGDFEGVKNLQIKERNLTKVFKDTFMNADGSSKIFEQTALSLIIANGLYSDIAPLKKQLKEHLIKSDYHFYVGMLGMQYLFSALDICDMREEAYKILTASGVPSYRTWFDEGATTLHEFFHETQSCNHHMYSCPIAWFYNTILGIKHSNSPESSHKITLSPYFLEGLTFANGSFKTIYGEIKVGWQRLGEAVILTVDVPKGVHLSLTLNHYNANGEKEFILSTGKNTIKTFRD